MTAANVALSDRVREFLAEPRFAVLATLNRDGSPHLTAIWYDARGDGVIFNTTAARVKHGNLSRDPRVSLLVGEAATYVRLDGRARRIAVGPAALEDMRRMATRYDGPEEAERQVRELYSKQERETYAIAVGRVYAYGFE